MFRKLSPWLLPGALAAAAAVAPLWCAPADSDPVRVALIVGNEAYSAVTPLRNAVNDARAIDKALRAAGFRTRLLENATKEQMDDALGAFADSLGPDHAALIYYAGHAFQIENENFLVPVDFKPARGLTQAKSRCFSLAQMFEELKRARARTRVVILDSCRSSPLNENYSLSAGLAQPLNAGKETFIAFSTGPNQVAADNLLGKNSWFSEALADLIAQPASIEINEIFNRVRKKVQTETEGRQVPWTTSSLSNAFYFRPTSGGDAADDGTLAQKWMDEAARRQQREDWTEAMALVNQVLARSPGGALEAAAKSRLPYLTARRDAQAAFDAGDFAKAAAFLQKAAEIDPFAPDAAFQAANAYLIGDKLPEALQMIKGVRVRGTSESIQRANAMLQELAKVQPEAGVELKNGIPKPPPAEEVFAGNRFGTPDWEGGVRYARSAPVDLGKWFDRLEADAAPIVLKTAAPAAAPASSAAPASPAATPPAPIPQPAPGAAATPPPASPAEDTHLEVIALGGTRELDYGNPLEPAPSAGGGVRRTPSTPKPKPAATPDPAQLGFLQVEGSPDKATTILLNGKPAPPVAGKLQLAAGSYEIRFVRAGQIVDRQTVDVKPSVVTRIKVN